MNERDLQRQLRREYLAATQTDTAGVPDFDEVWAAAQAAQKKQSQRRAVWPAVAAGIVAAAVTGLFVLNPWQQADDLGEFWITDLSESVPNASAWYAPSDVLLQQDGIDVYSSIPTLIESTELEVETLL